MTSLSKRRAERIKKEIPITKVLSDYNYEVDYYSEDREQQFRCDLHGDGSDNKPSARVYPESNTWYCWACEEARDAISTVQAKEGVSFWEACNLLEKKFNLPPLKGDFKPKQKVIDPKQIIREQKRTTFEKEKLRVRSFLKDLTSDRELSPLLLVSWWEVYDMINWRSRKDLPEEKAKEAMISLRLKIKDHLSPNK